MKIVTISIFMFLWICCFILLLILYIRNEKYKKDTVKVRNLEDLDCNNLEEKDLVFAKTKYISYDLPKNHIDKNTKKEYYTILKYINNILNKNNIPYALVGGTLIGSYRHLDIIPWDDDADICIKFEDHDKLMNLVDEFKKHNIHLQSGCLGCWGKYYEDVCKYCNLQHKKGHKDFVKVNMERPCVSTPYFARFSMGSVHVDIFHVIPIIDKYGKTMYSIYGNNRLISQSQYDKLFDTIDCKFGDIILKCPSNTKELLCQEYDNNLNIPTKNQMENKGKIPGMWMSGKNDTVGYFEIKNDEIIINNFKL
jgi:hypothetical protein